MHYLVDSDGVLFNWGKNWDRYAREHEHLGLTLTHNQKTFDLYEGKSEEAREKINEIMNMPSFYAQLEPIEGAAKAVNEMVAEGHEVTIVTSPWLTNITCAQDKLDSFEKHLGAGWGARAVITRDKTLVMGDILFDDKPDITGFYAPVWEHVYFTQPYNAQRTDKRRLDNWAAWRDFT
jgi:5'-nucleotidase